MPIEFDPAKDAANIIKHGLSLARFTGFDRQPHVAPDHRFDYGEPRFRAWGRINNLGHCLAYTTSQSGIRLISFRRARDKEMRRYE